MTPHSACGLQSRSSYRCWVGSDFWDETLFGYRFECRVRIFSGPERATVVIFGDRELSDPTSARPRSLLPLQGYRD